jgi:DNA-binding transcriptional regulator YiaG
MPVVEKAEYTSEEIRDLWQRSGLTQEEMARVLGVTLGAVERWINGRRAPVGLSISALRAFERMLARRGK